MFQLDQIHEIKICLKSSFRHGVVAEVALSVQSEHAVHPAPRPGSGADLPVQFVSDHHLVHAPEAQVSKQHPVCGII